MFLLVSVVCKTLVYFVVKHQTNKTLDTAYIKWIRTIQLTYLNNEWINSGLLDKSI